MENPTLEDEKKPFELDVQEDDAQPDPDEQLMLEQGNGRVWLVKMPKFLLERWSAIDAEDVHLATIRVYPDAVGYSSKKPRIVLFLPPNTNTPSSSQASANSTETANANRPVFDTTTTYPPTGEGAEPDSYELDMVHDSVDNQVVVAERPKDASFGGGSVNTRARTTILTGRVKHECNLRPLFTKSYRRQMKERNRKYNTPHRQIMRIEEAGVSGGRGGINRLSSGVSVGSGHNFGELIKPKPKPAKGTFERMARMPRNQLLDLLFSLFRPTPRWPIKVLRERTQQPEAYLKEVLAEIANLHRSGEFNGLWELKDNYKDPGIKAESVPFSSKMANGEMQDGHMDNDEDDDDEDDDMEEVS